MGLSNGAERLGCPWGAEQWGQAKVLPMGGCGAEHRNGALPTWGVLGSLIKQGVPKPQKPRDDKGTMGQQWGDNGATMGRQWGDNGAAMGRQRDAS